MLDKPSQQSVGGVEASASESGLASEIVHLACFPLERDTGFDPPSRHHTPRNLSETFVGGSFATS